MEFYSLKQHVEGWLQNKGIENCRVKGLGKGCHGVEIWILNGDINNANDFITKYGNMLETKFYMGWFSTTHNGYAVYVSMKNK
jgi:hypothetical protein